MKKLLLLLFLVVCLTVQSQYVKSSQITIYKKQSDLPTTADTGQLAYCLDVRIPFTFYGTAWMASSRTTVKKSTITINAKNTGATAIYTLESTSLNFYPIMIIPRVVNISNVTTPPTASIGTNSTSYNNIATSSLLSTVLAALSVGSGAPYNASYSPALTGGSVIYANISVGAIATTYSIQYDIVGYYN